MPPHCDTLDGPVVKAARAALDRGNVNLILAYVPKRAETELRHAFERTMKVRMLSPEARETTDTWFFETAVRLHREGEGAPFTGLKPAGLDPGPAIPRAEKALTAGRLEEISHFLCHTIEEQLQHRFHEVMTRKDYDENDVEAARGYVEAMLGFLVFSHSLYTAAFASPHEHEHAGHAPGGHRH